MNAGTLLKIAKDVIALMESQGLLLPDGSFDSAKFNSLTEDLSFAAGVEIILKNHGVDVPQIVDKVMAALPLLVAILK